MKAESLLVNSVKTEQTESVDVKRYHYGLNKFNFILAGGALFLVLVASYTLGDFSTFVPKTLDYENRTKERYQEIVDLYKRQNEVLNKTYDEYHNYMYEKHYKSDLIFVGVTHTIWLIPFIIFVFWRQPCPVRFDREKQLVYTWHRGKLYSASLAQLKVRFPRSHYLAPTNHFGPLEISLYAKNGTKEKRFRLGGYFSEQYQNGTLMGWLNQFMRHEVENDLLYSADNQWLKNTWVEKSLFPIKQLPEDKVLTALADAAS
jgi:hypothetical protein